jgi:lactate dehydrogenase-like 2-hydroxyacid dehydrogenase
MSTKPRVLITTPWPDAAVAAMRQRFDVEIHEGPLPMPVEKWLSAIKEFDAIAPTVIDRIPAEVYVAEGRRTKMLGNFGVGFNHIDIEAAKSSGLVVSNTPGVLTDTTADQAMGLLLAAARGISLGDWHVRAGLWEGWTPTDRLGHHVTGATLGIIGFGRIGQAMAKRAHFGFDMRIVFFNRSKVDAAIAEHYSADQLETVEDVLAASDFVSLHCPGGAETRHLINAERLKAMRPNGILINTARGDVVDEAALAAALDSGTIAGAGLDVFEAEPKVHPKLVELTNCVLNPHLGSATLSTRVKMGKKVVENLIAYFGGHSLPDRLA